MKRRQALVSLLSAGGVLAIPGVLQAQGQAVLVEVWKSPTCGCCQDWITHLEANGFRVKVNDVGNTAARARLKVPMKLGSCHTAWVGRYAIEGHVPAADIRRLLLALVYLSVMMLTEMITNNAAAMLMLPVALAVAQRAGLHDVPYVMAVMMAAQLSRRQHLP